VKRPIFFATPASLLGLALLGAAVLLSGCRGQTSRKPPLWIMHGMEFQPRYNAFEGNGFFADGRNMRTPPEGTVARGQLREDEAYYHGGGETPVAKIPMEITSALMERGQNRYNIYCTPCHSASGAGNGMVVQRGFLPPPSLHDARIAALPDGELFRVISDGIRNMPAYGKQIPEQDRWAIVAYVRALQYSRVGGQPSN
jgi:mono/diheme cytochrome c family protein